MAMKIEKKGETKDRISFSISGIGESTANAIRRSAFEIPTIAIDTVEFYKNDSALYDEMIAHRLGLVPLRVDIKLVEREKCSCKGKGCAKCAAALKLKAKGPYTVHASDLKTKGVEIVYPEMPIALLANDQELELSAEARLGKGLEHSKFNPGIIWHSFSANVRETKGEKGKKAMKVPAKEFEKIMQGKSNLIPDLIGESVECGGRFAEISTDSNELTFFVESFGQMKPKEVFMDAIDALDSNLDELAKALKKAK